MAKLTDEHLKLNHDITQYAHDAADCNGQCSCKYIDWINVTGWDFAWRCPTWDYHKMDAYGAAGKFRIVRDLLAGRLDWDSKTLRDTMYDCQLCGGCDTGCKRNLEIEVQMMLESVRKKLVETGNGPMPAHVEYTDKIEKSGNYFGEDQAKREKWLPRGFKPGRKADVLWFVGCRSSLDQTNLAKATLQVLEAAGVKFAMLDNEKCCGNFLFVTGQMDKARKLAEENIAAIKASGAKTVIFNCAECYKTLKVDYAKLLEVSTSDLPYTALHISEAMDGWIKEGKLKLDKRLDLKVTYHDSCSLSRMSEPWQKWEGVRGDWGVLEPPRKIRKGTYGVYDQPRNVLSAVPGVTLAEMPRNHENSYCCCAGGGVKEAFPDLAAASADERLREAATTGAEALVSTSPLVIENLRNSGSLKKHGLVALDLVEVVARAIKHQGE
jgi:Fe-S oxidoreductase